MLITKKLVGSLAVLALSASLAHADPAAGASVGSAPAPKACGADVLGTSRTLAVGTKGGLEVGEKSYPRTLTLADHEVVLTFDDGPGATTPAVLEALAHECVKASFFIIGRMAETQPALVRRELAEGHTLGHHTYSHPARTLRRMGAESAEADIVRGLKADDLAAFGVAGDAPRVPFFRFPGFADTPTLDAWLAKRDIGVFGADLWALDWLMLTPQAEQDYLMHQLDKTHRGIILLHDTRSSTARMMPSFLRALKAGGYRVVHIVPGPGAAETIPAQPGWTSETDRIIAEVFAREARGGHAGLAFTSREARGGHAGLAIEGREERRQKTRRFARVNFALVRLMTARTGNVVPKHQRLGAAKRTRTSTPFRTTTSR